MTVEHEEIIREIKQILTDLEHHNYGANGTISKKYKWDNEYHPQYIEQIDYNITFSLFPRKRIP